MPLYTWKDERTGKTVEVLRDFEDYATPPTEEEAAEAGFENKEHYMAEWSRLVQGGQKVTRGPNWGYGSKGNW
jgi:hypothetical protein